jgi:hypothetical protein
MHGGDCGDLAIGDREARAACLGTACKRGISHGRFAFKREKSISEIVCQQFLHCRSHLCLPFPVRKERDTEQQLHQNGRAQIQRFLRLTVQPGDGGRVGQRLQRFGDHVRVKDDHEKSAGSAGRGSRRIFNSIPPNFRPRAANCEPSPTSEFTDAASSRIFRISASVLRPLRAARNFRARWVFSEILRTVTARIRSHFPEFMGDDITSPSLIATPVESQIASRAMITTPAPISRLVASVSANTSGSSLSSPREASSHTRQSQRISNGMISHSSCARR